jgi:hypothetical protein
MYWRTGGETFDRLFKLIFLIALVGKINEMHKRLL